MFASAFSKSFAIECGQALLVELCVFLVWGGHTKGAPCRLRHLYQWQHVPPQEHNEGQVGLDHQFAAAAFSEVDIITDPATAHEATQKRSTY